jgi:ribonuclease P protein subunit RPR2
MDPRAVDDVETMRQQLLLFAEDLRTMAGRERMRREEAEVALHETRDAYLTLVRTLANVCEMKDNYTRDHLDRTYQFAMSLTKRVAPELAENASIQYGYLLHDIGKVGIPDSILNKPGPLDDQEWAQMKTHPLIGFQLVKNIRFLGDAVHIVRSHHERWDGRGYPEGARGEDIYLPARIFSIIDTFDAMTTNRPYRAAMPVHAALEEIERMGGTQFDPDLAVEFVRMCEERDITAPDALHFVR